MQEIVKEMEIQNPFNGDRPGNGWYAAFLKRHPHLVVRTPEAVSQASACVSEQDIRGWFDKVTELLREEDLLEIQKYPKRNWNGDETGFRLSPDGKLVLAVRGMKDVYQVDAGPAKEAITCMHSFSADGDVAYPMLIFPYQRVPGAILEKVPSNWGVGKSESGWMTSEVFYEYIGNVFNTYLDMNNIEKPIIYYVDGHKSHLTIHTSKLCKDLGIVLVALYPNATRILQPADVAAFRPIKMGWTNAVREWRRNHLNETLTKKWVAPLLQDILKKPNMPQIYRNGFRATGLFPWDPNAIDFSKCLGSNNRGASVESDDDEEPSIEPKVITPERFIEIVGEEKIAIFEGMHAHEGGEEAVEERSDRNSTTILYALWRELGLGKSSIPEDTPPNSEEVADEPVDEGQDGTSSSGAAQIPTPEPKSAEKILQWPESPKRKGKRLTERLPFFLTSQKWQDLMEEKGGKRKAEEEAKEERKRARGQKKQEKVEELKRKQQEKENRLENRKKQVARGIKGVRGGKGRRGRGGGVKKQMGK